MLDVIEVNLEGKIWMMGDKKLVVDVFFYLMVNWVYGFDKFMFVYLNIDRVIC